MDNNIVIRHHKPGEPSLKEKGYHHVFLWTIDICTAALHLYEKFGFKCTDTKANDTWANYHMTEELWEYWA